MPAFPTYHGELPECLNPLNLRHYFLLAYWVFFRPTALKCYLYQADPELYRLGWGTSVFRTLRIPAYRNLYTMVPGTITLFSILVGIPLGLILILVPGTYANWPAIFSYIAFAVAFAVAYSLVIGVTIGISSSISGSVAGGTTLIMTFSIVFGVALVVALEVISVIAYIAYGTGTAIGYDILVSTIFGIAFGTVITASGSVTFSAAITAASGIAFIVAFGRQAMETVGTDGFITFVSAFIIGALRVPFYTIQLGSALYSVFRREYHPLEWDELVILPLPGTRRALTTQLKEDELEGLRFVAAVARNVYQRWAAQRILQSYVHSQTSPTRSMYALLASPDMGTYIFAPSGRTSWRQRPSVIQVLLGELNGQWIPCHAGWLDGLLERLVWVLTWPLRDRRKTPLTRFAGMLYELLDEETINTEGFDLSIYADIYTGLTDYPGGEEIARTFEAMATFLSYSDLSALPAVAALPQVAQPAGGSPIHPTAITALNSLVQIGAEVATYRVATSRVNQLAALARATNALDALDDYVTAEVMAPEQTILHRIIRQWRRLISEASGEVGRAEEIGPVANPYVAGNPVTGHLFVGRQDVLRRLEELWIGEGQKPSVVLYGHRRMGKSSILHNLGTRFGTQAIIADFNMQRVGLVGSTGELLYNLALALYDSLPPAAREGLEGGEPDEERFTDHNPYTAFDRFLKRVDQARDARRFFVTVDEFELIEALIAAGKLEPHLLDFCRGVIQTYPWFVMTFAGLHTLQEMTRDYWHPLFGSVIGIPVSFLGHEAAGRLITQPTPDFPLDYDQDAIEHIFTLTNGQPYLTQLIGHGLVTRFNRQTYEEGIERERRFSLVDVNAVINAPEFYRDGDAYFTGVWRQAETSEPPGQTVVLNALAQSEAGMAVEEIAFRANLSSQEITAALDTLARHDVVVEADDGWRFTVELMHRWVKNQDSGKNAISSG